MDDTTKHNNFLRAKWQLSVLRTGRITEDFVEDCKDFLQILREFFPDFRYVNMDIQAHDFRMKADEAEELYEMLVIEYRRDKFFNLEIYVELLERVLYMTEYVHEDVELADLLNTMTVR